MRKFLLTLVSFAMVLSVWAQERAVSGKVTSSEDGSSLPGVNVVLKGTATGAVTDAEGSYKLNVPTAGGTLVFSFIGLVTQEVEIGQRSVVDVQMAADVQQLSEVVVTALGIKEDRDKFASSAASVKGTSVAKSGETGVLQGLAAKTAGVLIVRNGGDPGAGAYIQIRGQNTINGNAQPLFIVDGVPVNNSNEYGLSGAGNSIVTQSRINDINPEDIASMEVLKGASAAALWGTRAANGVIIITTKKGQDTKGKVNVSIKSTVSFDEVNKMHDLQTVFGNGDKGHYAMNNRVSYGDQIADRKGGADATTGAAYVTLSDGSKRYATPSGSGFSWDGTGAAAHGGKNSKDTYNHKTDVFQTGHFVDNNMTISGGNARSNFLMSYSNLTQQGVIKNFSDYTRNSARLNASSQFTDWIRGSASASYVGSYSTRAQTGDNLDGLMLGGLRTPPDFNNAFYSGTYTDATGAIFPDKHVAYRDQLGAGDHPVYSNPLWNINNNKNTTTVDRFIGNMELSADPTSWLNITGRAGVDYFTDKNKELFPVHSATFPTGYYQVNNTTEKQINMDFFARAQKQFNSNFSGNLLFGVNYNDRYRNTDHTQITDFIVAGAPPNLNNGLTSNLQAYNYTTHIRTYAYYAQAELQAYDQLFLTLTGRSESASTYNNSFFFPSAALAWQFTKLEALKGGSTLSFGKLRLTAGQVGIQPQPYLNNTLFVNTIYYDGYAYGLNASSGVYGGGYGQSYLAGNPNLKPEVKTEVEIGADLRFFNNKLSFSITAYNNHTDNLLLALGLPDASGFNQIWKNAASMENKGLEIELGYDIIKKGNFSWNITGNWSANRNKVTSMGGTDAQTVPGGGAYAGQSLIAGQPFGVFYGAVLQHDEKGKYILDGNGFPQFGTQNEIYGNPNPMWRAGIGTTVAWKGVSLYVLFDRVYGNDFWNGTRGALATFGTSAETGHISTSSSPLKTVDGLTIPANTPFRGEIRDFGGGPVALTQAYYQTLGTSFSAGNADLFKEDGGSTRLREVTLSYSLRGAGFTKATKLASVDFSLTGRNLMLWTNYTGIDPEGNITGASLARGSDWFISPATRSVLFTIKVTY
ncbi:MAG: SusC/RagA family TonB-linked outer membrane protein [Bacteroidetes bacterium]|nr:SusC/RagA family TonB-linked outer membrane protein [Bacteroidota bacterium]